MERSINVWPVMAHPRPNNPTRWSLVRRLANPEDVPAWEEFYATYGRLIHSLAIRSGLSSEEAEDAVQDTVASMVKSLPNFRADPSAGSFKSWLFTLARWRINNQFEKRPKLGGGYALAGRQALERPSGTGTMERVADPSPNLIEVAWDAEWEEAVLGIALRRLKEHARAEHFQVFYLHVIKQQSPGMVAEALGVSTAQVYLTKCRLLPRFKRLVSEIRRSPV